MFHLCTCLLCFFIKRFARNAISSLEKTKLLSEKLCTFDLTKSFFENLVSYFDLLLTAVRTGYRDFYLC